MPSKVYLLSGVPGSGKSTWVAKQTGIVISRDQIRYSLLKDGEDYFSHEDEVMRIFKERINEAIKTNSTVYIDATHLNWRSRQKIIDCIPSNTPIGVISFTVPLQTCLTRNAKRTGRVRVPENVVRKMHNSFTTPASDPYEYFDIQYINE